MSPRLPRLPRRISLLGANPAFRRLWIGQFTSGLGSSMTVLSIPLLAVATTGSPARASVLATLGFVTTWLTAVPAGQLADRIGPRRLMLGCDAARLVCVAAVAAGALLGGPPLWLLGVSVVVSGAAMMAFNPASGKMLRTIVPAEQLPEAVSANQIRGYTAGVAGPAAGGALFALGRAVPFALDALSYLVSLVCVRGLPAGAGAGQAAGPRGWPDLRTGLAVLWRTPFLRGTLGYSVPANTAVSMLTYVLLLRPGADGGGIGASLSAAAVCGLVGSAFAPYVHRRFGLHRILLGVCLLRLLGTAAAALLGGPVALGAALAGVLLLGPVVGAAIGTTTLLVVDYEVYGRVVGTTSFIGGALQPLAPLAAGFLLQTVGAARALAVVAVLFALCTAAVLAARRGLDVKVPTAAPDAAPAAA
ncbi:MFS transporter [Kitasatospora sp. NPDC048540]|uniref:MFS transporter n=1 Tax=unclassified Kitasatospora TaxID=2633591 RepID=UPI00053A7849|nr:MFS transporter [Kitasatospora sp. MBT63]